MEWLKAFFSLDPTTAQALTGLLYAAALLGVIGILYVVIRVRRANGRGNGIGDALKIDERIDILEKHQVELETKMKDGLENLQYGLGELNKTTSRLNRELGGITTSIDVLMRHLNNSPRH